MATFLSRICALTTSALVLSVVTLVDAAPAPAPTDYDNVARFIAGMIPDSGSPLFALTASAGWKKYHTVTDSTWARFGKNKLDKIAAWSSKEMPAFATSTATLFYPFSGPDFVFAHSFFPAAGRYVMFGLEPVGVIPDPSSLAADSLSIFFRVLDKAIEDALSFSFFKTNDMKQDLASELAPGTLPIIMLFVARTGNHVVGIRPFHLDSTGVPQYLDTFKDAMKEKSYNYGCEVTFRKDPASPIQTIVYFSTDISDGALAKNGNTRKFLAGLDTAITTYIKSASYLMHKGYFSVIRNTVLSKSKAILQDDSGIAYRYFKKSDWKITLYGTYTGPIELFKDDMEDDLKAAYEKGAKPLTVRLGYGRVANQLLAIRR